MFEVVEISTGDRYTIYWIHRDKVNGLAKGLVFKDGKWDFVPMDKFIPVEVAEEVERDLERHPRIFSNTIVPRKQFNSDDDDYDDDEREMEDHWD